MIKFSMLKENNTNDNILIIVDVQQEFSKFIQSDLVDELMKYATGFGTVYQIWDSNKAEKPTYTFPNQAGCFVKKYGTTFSKELLNITKDLAQTPTKEGDRFKFKGVDSYVVRVKNNHGWFYIPEEMSDLFKTLKGRQVTVVGGADTECLKDVFEALESFGASPTYNRKYIYSAKTTQNDKVA